MVTPISFPDDDIYETESWYQFSSGINEEYNVQLHIQSYQPLRS